uniref:Yippee domain-containing protein n=1 Tax=Globisporangium ultimum (strain ATCC 200006 / CBS 805.95 / DAOM BR144) TaxID=431595 RepID=K3WVT3_GLOUD
MAPLVVIRGGSKLIEYRESRSEWLRLQQLKLHGGHDDDDDSSSSSGSDDDTNDEYATARSVETEWQHQRARRQQLHHLGTDLESSLSSSVAETARCAALGLSTDLHALEGMRGFHCVDCGNLVADRDDVVAKSFFGRTGKAFLMNSMFNIRTGLPRNRYLMTGMHTIADVVCKVCDAVLGWKYLKAMETSQKYKEGKFIVEKALVHDDADEKTWQHL